MLVATFPVESAQTDNRLVSTTLPVSWDVQGKLREGQLEALRQLAAEMIYIVKTTEPGALNYEWYLSAEHSICHISVSFVDVPSAVAHLKMFRKEYAVRLYNCIERTSVSVYGEIDQELRTIFDEFDAIYLGDFGGFRR